MSHEDQLVEQQHLLIIHVLLFFQVHVSLPVLQQPDLLDLPFESKRSPHSLASTPQAPASVSSCQVSTGLSLSSLSVSVSVSVSVFVTDTFAFAICLGSSVWISKDLLSTW